MESFIVVPNVFLVFTPISKSRKHSSSIPQFSLESHRMDYKSHDVN